MISLAKMMNVSKCSLKDYIENKHNHSWKNIEDLYDHFYIEFEMHCYSENHQYIYEKYGKYDDQIELVRDLTNNIFDTEYSDEIIKFNISKEDIQGYKNVFYNELEILWGANIGTAYVPLENNFDNNTKRFKKVKIKLDSYRGNTSRTKLFKSIMHELTHAWHDYSSFIKDNGKSLTTLGKESKYYHNIRKDKPITNGENFCKTLMYLTTKFESNAYASEIYSELENQKNKIEQENKEKFIIYSWNEAWEIFRNSDTYKQILKIYTNLNNIEHYSDSIQMDFVNYFNKHNQTNLTLNKIKKRYIYKLEKLFDKICKTCAKIYYDFVENQKIENDIKEGLMTYYDLSNYRL